MSTSDAVTSSGLQPTANLTLMAGELPAAWRIALPIVFCVGVVVLFVVGVLVVNAPSGDVEPSPALLEWQQQVDEAEREIELVDTCGEARELEDQWTTSASIDSPSPQQESLNHLAEHAGERRQELGCQ